MLPPLSRPSLSLFLCVPVVFQYYIAGCSFLTTIFTAIATANADADADDDDDDRRSKSKFINFNTRRTVWWCYLYLNLAFDESIISMSPLIMCVTLFCCVIRDAVNSIPIL